MALKVSVAMCTCNGEAFLGEQLESIVAQTRPLDELIVSDDVSNDRTLEILNSFKERCPFPVKVLVNPTRVGVCRNFENAIKHCSGDIIFLADQDDVWLPAKISTMMTVFEAHPRCGYVFSNADLVDEDGRAIGRDLWTSIAFTRGQQLQYARGQQLEVMLRRFTLSYGMAMAFRAIFKPRLMPFECRFFRAIVHDGWISLVLTSIGAYGVAVPESLVKYRQHRKQLASAGEPLTFTDLVKMKRSSVNEENRQLADLLDHLAIRLQQMEPESESVVMARKQLTEKATHVRARVRAISSNGMERIRTVLLEALSGRYGRYSRSVRSILKDLTTN